MSEHELLLLLRRANPMPNGGVHPTTEADAGSPKGQEMTITQTDTTTPPEPTASPRRQTRWALTAAAALLIIGVVGAIGARQLPVAGPPEPVTVAEGYFDAITRADADAWWALFADDAMVFSRSLADPATQTALQNFFDVRTAWETDYRDVSCDQTGTVNRGTGAPIVRCEYVMGGPIPDRLEVTLHGTALLAIDDGRIVNLQLDNTNYNPVANVPNAYLQRHHQAAFEAACSEQSSFAPADGTACGRLYIDNLDGIAQMWEERFGD